jgi:hypothetical protein
VSFSLVLYLTIHIKSYKRVVAPILQSIAISVRVKIVSSAHALTFNNIVGLSNFVLMNNRLPVELVLPQIPTI